MAAVFSNSVERIQGPLLRPFFWASGVFYLGSELPARAQHALSWNPLYEIIQLTRDGWFSTYSAPEVGVAYVMYWILGLTLLGLLLERPARRRIELT